MSPRLETLECTARTERLFTHHFGTQNGLLRPVQFSVTRVYSPPLVLSLSVSPSRHQQIVNSCPPCFESCTSQPDVCLGRIGEFAALACATAFQTHLRCHRVQHNTDLKSRRQCFFRPAGTEKKMARGRADFDTLDGRLASETQSGCPPLAVKILLITRPADGDVANSVLSLNTAVSARYRLSRTDCTACRRYTA